MSGGVFGTTIYGDFGTVISHGGIFGIVIAHGSCLVLQRKQRMIHWWTDMALLERDCKDIYVRIYIYICTVFIF